VTMRSITCIIRRQPPFCGDSARRFRTTSYKPPGIGIGFTSQPCRTEGVSKTTADVLIEGKSYSSYMEPTRVGKAQGQTHWPKRLTNEGRSAHVSE
jgi:hypothetical protein